MAPFIASPAIIMDGPRTVVMQNICEAISALQTIKVYLRTTLKYLILLHQCSPLGWMLQ
jgi:hypothetical protein